MSLGGASLQTSQLYVRGKSVPPPGIPVYVNKINPKKDGAFISFGKKFKNDTNYFNLSKKSDLKEAANNLYKTMRIIKKLKFKSISVCRIPKLGLGLAINDRLKKAANK